MLMAARKDTCTGLFLEKYDIWIDQHYKENGKPYEARSKFMICKVCFKQNIHLSGKEINVCMATVKP